MKINFKILLLFFIANIFIVTQGSAQKFTTSINISNKSVQVGNVFKLTYSISSKDNFSITGIQRPIYEGFSFVRESNGESHQNINGNVKHSFEYTLFLKANKKGTFKITPATFIAGKINTKSSFFTVQVGASDPKSSVAPPKNSNLFTRIDVSKKNPFKGDVVLVTYKIYSLYGNLSLDAYDYSMIDGVWTEEISAGKNGWPSKQEIINGARYNIFTLKKEIVFPQKTGEIKIPAFDITARINRSFFNQGSVLEVKSNAQVLKVKALPNNAPLSFESQVGKGYKFEVTYSTTELKTNEPIDLKIKISGKGNLKQLNAPALNFPTDFEVFDPETKNNVKVSSSGLNGSKEFTYLIIPRHYGVFDIDPIEFSYFNTATGRYKTLKSEALTINVLKGDNQDLNLTSTGNKEDVELLSNEIRHIEHETELTPLNEFFFGTTNYYLALGSPLLLFILFFFIKRKTGQERNEAELTHQNASKSALARLSKAEEHLKNNSDSEYFEELHNAIDGYLSHKFKIPVSGLNKKRIEEELTKISIDVTTITDLLKVLNDCEMARFAPLSHSDAETTLTTTKTLINEIEKHVKK
jgi:hypothetical protein